MGNTLDNSLVSRQAVLEKIHEAPYINDCSNIGMLLEAWINSIPSVKPQYTDAEIQKMQDLEFAEIQKAYEIGKEEGSSENPNKWIPVSERYPEDGQRVLVDYCDEDMGIMLMRFNAHGYRGFKAWMPLPEPFEGNTK